MPDADVEPQRLVRFGARSVLTVILPVVAAIIVLTSVNVDEISTALASSDWRWAAVGAQPKALARGARGQTEQRIRPNKAKLLRGARAVQQS